MGKAAVLVVNIYTLLVTCTEQCTVYTVLYNLQFLFGNKTLYFCTYVGYNNNLKIKLLSTFMTKCLNTSSIMQLA